MYNARIENSHGKVLTLTHNEDAYQVLNIIGLAPTPSHINTTASAGLDGVRYNSARLDPRSIVILLKLTGDLDRNRQAIYRHFPVKSTCRFYFSSSVRSVYIDGQIENIECEIFTDDECMQISMLCPDPHFRDINRITSDISSRAPLFSFPFSINLSVRIPISSFLGSRITNVYNASDDVSGIDIDIDVLGEVNLIDIRNTETGEKFALRHSFWADDHISISTYRGRKSVTLVRGGVAINIFNKLVKGSTFLQLASGDNFFGYYVDEGRNNALVDISITHYNVYQGV